VVSSLAQTFTRCPGTEDLVLCNFINQTDVGKVRQQFTSVTFYSAQGTSSIETFHPYSVKDIQLVSQYVQISGAQYYALTFSDRSRVNSASGDCVLICPSQDNCDVGHTFESPFGKFTGTKFPGMHGSDELIIVAPKFYIKFIVISTGNVEMTSLWGFALTVVGKVPGIGWQCTRPPKLYTPPSRVNGLNSSAVSPTLMPSKRYSKPTSQPVVFYNGTDNFTPMQYGSCMKASVIPPAFACYGTIDYDFYVPFGSSIQQLQVQSGSPSYLGNPAFSFLPPPCQVAITEAVCSTEYHQCLSAR
jgi:hypothetical protein